MSDNKDGAAQVAAPESETVPENAAAAEAEGERLWKEAAAAERESNDDNIAEEEPEKKQAAEESDTAEEPEKEQPGAAPESDPWKDAPEPLRKAHEATEKELKELRHYKQSQFGRHAAFERRIAELRAEVERLKNAGPSAGKADDPKKADKKDTPKEGTQAGDQPELPPNLKKAVEEYPEVAGPLAEVIGQQMKVIEELKKNLSDLAQSKDGDARERYIEAQTGALVEAHPDWHILTGVPGGHFKDEMARKSAADKFTAWVSKQPRYVQEAAAANGKVIVDAEAAIDLIGRYKAHLRETGQATQTTNPGAQGSGASPKPNAQDAKRARQLESAASPRTSRPGVSVSGPPDDEEAAFKYFARRV